jgi:hypothetical protein
MLTVLQPPGPRIYPIAQSAPWLKLPVEVIMRLILALLALTALLSTSGCVIREGRGGEGDHYWHGYGHGEHWEHHDWR